MANCLPFSPKKCPLRRQKRSFFLASRPSKMASKEAI
nr:MAG TPA: hypothetical protein [Caudoviricetes sp.]